MYCLLAKHLHAALNKVNRYLLSQGTQRYLQVFVGDFSRELSMFATKVALQTIETSAFPAPLRENRTLNPQQRILYQPGLKLPQSRLVSEQVHKNGR